MHGVFAFQTQIKTALDGSYKSSSPLFQLLNAKSLVLDAIENIGDEIDSVNHKIQGIFYMRTMPPFFIGRRWHWNYSFGNICCLHGWHSLPLGRVKTKDLCTCSFLSVAVQCALLDLHISHHCPYLPGLLTVIVLSCQIWSGSPFYSLLLVTCHRFLPHYHRQRQLLQNHHHPM